MGTPKWYNMFPHGNYGIFNLDFLLQKYGEQDERIKKVEEKNIEQDTRLDADEADIAQLQDDMIRAKDDIDALESRMDTAEGDIDALEGRMDTAESDIDALEGRMDTAEGDIDALESAVGDSTTGLVKDVTDLKQDVSDIKQDIIDIQTKDQAQDNAIDGLDSRVTTLENTDAVIANPGGSGPLLNTVSISGTTYSIDNSGGGGGGGSSVTPNPAGSPTQTLDKVDIDGTIYGIPVTAADKTAIEGDISDLQSDVSDLEDELQDNVNVLTTWAGGVEELFEGNNDNSVQDIPDASITITEPGLYLFILNSRFDTRNFGSNPRDLGLYLRRYISDPLSPDPAYNLGLAKAHINGNENSMITQAYNMNLTRTDVVTGNMIHDGLNNYKASFRVNAATTKAIEVGCYVTCIKLDGIDRDPYTP